MGKIEKGTGNRYNKKARKERVAHQEARKERVAHETF